MKFSFRYPNTFFFQNGIKIETKDGLYVYDAGKGPSEACAALIRMCLKAHASAIVFSKKTEYFPLVKDHADGFVETFIPKEMFNSTDYPWISGLSKAATDSMASVFSEAHLERSLICLKGRRKGLPVFPRPGMAQCFYQISDRGSKKDRILTEALFTGLLTETVKRDEVRETVFFYDAPYRPQTAEALNAIITASEENATLIGVYEGSGEGYKRGRYGITHRDGRTYIKDRGREREISSPQDR